MADCETEEGANIIGALILLVSVPLEPLFEGWALSVLWTQNAVPWGAPPIGGWAMTGIVCAITAARLVLLPKPVKKSSDDPKAFDLAFASAVRWVVLALFVGLSTWVTG